MGQVVGNLIGNAIKFTPRGGSINVEMDRAGFTVNPTSCAEKRIGATLTSTEGAVHQTGTRFRVGDCASLRFAPKLALRLSGKGKTKTGAHPGLRAVVTQKSGEATYGPGNNGLFGSVRSGTLERSNVDITEELVALIGAQRNFQANAKAIDTANSMTQTIMNLRN